MRCSDIGEELHDREIQQLTREQEKAVYMAQETIWEQAEAMRVEAVEKALHVAQDEHEMAMKRMARAHERTLRVSVDAHWNVVPVHRVVRYAIHNTRIVYGAIHNTRIVYRGVSRYVAIHG